MNKNKSRNKYNHLLTHDFLEKEYIKNQKSISQIAKDLGIYWSTIKTYLQAHKIKLRTHKEQAVISSPGGKYKYNNFLTKEFFLENYISSNNSITLLSAKTGINWHVLRRYIKRLGIPVRSHSKQKELSYPPKEFQLMEKCLTFFDGLLLGDGSIPKRSNGAPSRLYSQSCKHKEYLRYVKKRALMYGITFSPILTHWIDDPRCKKGGYVESFLQSHHYKTFEILRKRWYDEKKRKRIPKDLKLSSDTVLQLYLSDGNFYREIRLCVSGFKMSDVLFLKKLIEKNLNIKTRLTPSPGLGKDILIKKSDTKKFLSYIGKCPVKCYAYKWKDNESEEQRLKQNQRAREIYNLKRKNLL